MSQYVILEQFRKYQEQKLNDMRDELETLTLTQSRTDNLRGGIACLRDDIDKVIELRKM